MNLYESVSKSLKESEINKHKDWFDALVNSNSMYHIGTVEDTSIIKGKFITQKFDDGVPCLKYFTRDEGKEISIELHNGDEFIVYGDSSHPNKAWIQYSNGWIEFNPIRLNSYML